MSNGRVRFVKRKPNARWDAYDSLPPLTRQALQEGPQQWCDIDIAKRIKKMLKDHPTLTMQSVDRFMANIINRWHLDEVAEAKPWQPQRKPFERKPTYPVASPHIAASATMQTSNRKAA
jgi:hypothetical protein